MKRAHLYVLSGLLAAVGCGFFLYKLLVLGFPLEVWPALAVVGLTALTNIVLRARKPRPQRLDERQSALILGFDIVQLALLLYLTGGLANPFSVLFLAPVLISATALSMR